MVRPKISMHIYTYFMCPEVPTMLPLWSSQLRHSWVVCNLRPALQRVDGVIDPMVRGGPKASEKPRSQARSEGMGPMEGEEGSRGRDGA